jgi:hypothetical protein
VQVPSVGWLVGAQYTSGPLVVGASFFRFSTTGDLPGGIDAGSGATITSAGLTTGQQVNNGAALGGTYTLVPGVNLDVMNRTCLPSDIIAFVVFCRLRYRLTPAGPE